MSLGTLSLREVLIAHSTGVAFGEDLNCQSVPPSPPPSEHLLIVPPVHELITTVLLEPFI